MFLLELRSLVMCSLARESVELRRYRAKTSLDFIVHLHVISVPLFATVYATGRQLNEALIDVQISLHELGPT